MLSQAAWLVLPGLPQLFQNDFAHDIGSAVTQFVFIPSRVNQITEM